MANAWRRHLTQTHIWTHKVHKHICSLSVTRAYVCVCKTKLAVSYSQAVETDLPQCFHCLMWGEEYRERWSTVQRGGLPSIENQCRKISTHTDVAVVRVRLLHARCTNAEQLHNPKRNCWRRRENLPLIEQKRRSGWERLMPSIRTGITIFA